jgi:hypothetical protein
MDALLHCRNHADRTATIKCDECGRVYCRECVSERWITSRSSVWVCSRCTGAWRPSSAVGSGAGLTGAALGRYLPLGAVVALAALFAALHGGVLGP